MYISVSTSESSDSEERVGSKCSYRTWRVLILQVCSATRGRHGFGDRYA
jgi:hypothetical protein